MRAGITAIVTFVSCFLALITIMTIGSYNLQKDELQRATDFAVKQTVRQCIAEEIEDENKIASMIVQSFKSQVNSKNGTLDVYVLHADKNIIDVGVMFKYKQYNGSEKSIACRSTVIRDWEEGKEEGAEIRFISQKYFNKSPDEGGLKENSIWKTDATLFHTLTNTASSNGNWTNFSKKVQIKREMES